MEWDCDFGLIGRNDDITKLEKIWDSNCHRIFVVHGPKLVGKSRFTKKFRDHISESESFHLIEIDFRKVGNLEEFEYFLFSNEVFTTDHEKCARSIDSHSEDTIPKGCFKCTRKLEKEIKELGPTRKIVFFFDNVEKVDKADRTLEDTYDLVMRLYMMDLVRSNCNVRLVITSTTKLAFASVNACQFPLGALDAESSLSLLKTVTKATEEGPGETDEEGSLREIAAFCDGLPLAIISAGLLLKERNSLWKPDDVLSLMLEITVEVFSRETLSSDDDIDFNLHQAFKFLSEKNQDNLLTLAAILCDGRGVTKQRLADMAKYYGYKGEPTDLPFFKWKVLGPLYNKNLVNFDSRNQTISMSCNMMEKFLHATQYIPKDKRGKILGKLEKLKGEQEALKDQNNQDLNRDDSIVPSTGGATVPSSGGATVPSSGGATVPSSVGVTAPSTGGSIVPSIYRAKVPSTVGATVPSIYRATVSSTGVTTVPSTGRATAPSTLSGATVQDVNPEIYSNSFSQSVESQESLNNHASSELEREGSLGDQDINNREVSGATANEIENELSRTSSLESSCEENTLSSLTNFNARGGDQTLKEEKRALAEEKKLDTVKEIVQGDNQSTERSTTFFTLASTNDPVITEHTEPQRRRVLGVPLSTEMCTPFPDESTLSPTLRSDKGQLLTIEKTLQENESLNSSGYRCVHVGATRIVNDLDAVSIEENVNYPLENGIQGRNVRDDGRKSHPGGEISSTGNSCGSIGLESDTLKLDFDSILTTGQHTEESLKDSLERKHESGERNSAGLLQETGLKMTSMSTKPHSGLSLL